MIEIKYSNFNFTGAAYKSIKSAAKIASAQIIKSIKSESPLYKIFSGKHARTQAKSCAPYAREINKNFSDLIVIGMGGAVLNPETVTSLLAPNNSSTQLHFLNNTDPFFLQNLLSGISLENCAILAISNSGQTLETIALAGVMISEFENAAIADIGKHFYFITNLQSGILKNVAGKIGATLIEHTEKISGRYSGLTNVTTLVAQIAGIDVREYLAGAQLILNDFLEYQEESQAALSAAALYSTGKSITVNIGYLQRFDVFLEWYSQIIAESLGKDNKGITPIKGLGPNDQHSMLQLYLDGPKDKVFSLFYTGNDSTAYKSCNLKELNYIAGKNLQNINRANFEATLHTLIETGAPTRSIMLKSLSAKNVGSLVMHSMLETIILGHIMQLNPFNQPGVEFIKKESMRIIQTNSKY